jgi:RES domain-containing protein
VVLAVDAVHVDGEWTRQAPHHSHLLGQPETPTDSRWQHGEIVSALYVADARVTAVAEWFRFLAELGIPPGRAVPHDHHVWQLNLELADPSTDRRLAKVGLRTPRPGRATWTPYQDTGETLWREGWAGLLAPSTARPEALIACIFATQWPPAGCAPIEAIEIGEAPPPQQVGTVRYATYAQYCER